MYNILKESMGRSRDNKKFPTASSNGRENESVSVGSGQIMKGLCWRAWIPEQDRDIITSALEANIGWHLVSKDLGMPNCSQQITCPPHDIFKGTCTQVTRLLVVQALYYPDPGLIRRCFTGTCGLGSKTYVGPSVLSGPNTWVCLWAQNKRKKGIVWPSPALTLHPSVCAQRTVARLPSGGQRQKSSKSECRGPQCGDWGD